MADWNQFICASRSRWFSIVKAACTYDNDHHHFSTDPVLSITNSEVRCPFCTYTTMDVHALAGHVSNAHKHKNLARWYAPASTCNSCHKVFGNRPRLLRHMAYASKPCLTNLVNTSVPLDNSVVEALDAEDLVILKSNKSKGLPIYFATAPVHKHIL